MWLCLQQMWCTSSLVVLTGAVDTMGDSLKFILDGEIREITDFDPAMTLLDFLRNDLRRMGGKDGCSQGDCGACTVVVGALDGQGKNITYRAINSCILFLPLLAGKELITIESLDGNHPLQRAMLEQHASQCGFCTPGVVMSLYARYENGEQTDIHDTLVGNLCRCTGYGPLIRAAEQAGVSNTSPREEKLALLKSIQRTNGLEITHGATSRQYFAPLTLAALGELREEHPNATLFAGGTDVGLPVGKQYRSLDCLIYLGDVAELQVLEEKDGALHIGAGVRYGDVMKRLSVHYPDFAEVIRRIGSVQVRSQGTIGGNIANASPTGDSIAPLIALGATLVLGVGRTILLEDYFIAYGKQDIEPGEFIEKIILPLPRENQLFRAYKLSKRFDQDISALCMAISFNLEGGVATGVRLAFSGMADIPKRAVATEKSLEGQLWNEENILHAVKILDGEFDPISDIRASAGYRRRVAGNLLLKACLETTSQQTVRVTAHG